MNMQSLVNYRNPRLQRRIYTVTELRTQKQTSKGPSQLTEEFKNQHKCTNDMHEYKSLYYKFSEVITR